MWKLIKVEDMYRVVWTVPERAIVIKSFATKKEALSYFYKEYSK